MKKRNGRRKSIYASWSDNEVTQLMINYLLENLQPYLWAKKSQTLRNFQEFYFSQYPKLTSNDVREILCGRDQKGRGLLQTVSNRTWPSGNLKPSAGASIELLLRLLDPSEHPQAHLFSDVIKTLSIKYLKAMNLGRHVNFKGGNRDSALRLIRYFKTHRPDLKIIIETPKAEEERAIKENDERINRRSSIVQQLLQPSNDTRQQFERRLSTRSMAQNLVNRNIIKIDGSNSSNDSDDDVSKMKTLKKFFTLRGRKIRTSSDDEEHTPGLVFGVNLDILVNSDKEKVLVETKKQNDIPLILQQTSDCIESRGLKHVGIFRLPGNERHIRETRQLLDGGLTVNFNSLHIDVVANLLKLWLRELPEPLFTFDLYQEIVDAQKAYDDNDDKRRSTLKEICDKLPTLNHRIIAFLIAFLSRLAEFHPHHKMTARNLALVFAPNILRPKEESYLQVVQDTPLVMGAVHDFISYYSYFFSKYSFKGSQLAPEQLDEGGRRVESLPDAVLNAAKKHDTKKPSPALKPKPVHHKRDVSTLSFSTDDTDLLAAAANGRVRSRTIDNAHSGAVPMFFNPNILKSTNDDAASVSSLSSDYDTE